MLGRESCERARPGHPPSERVACRKAAKESWTLVSPCGTYFFSSSKRAAADAMSCKLLLDTESGHAPAFRPLSFQFPRLCHPENPHVHRGPQGQVLVLGVTGGPLEDERHPWVSGSEDLLSGTCAWRFCPHRTGEPLTHFGGAFTTAAEPRPPSPSSAFASPSASDAHPAVATWSKAVQSSAPTVVRQWAER